MLKTNESAENYLETILVLSQKKPVVRGVDIAEELGFKDNKYFISRFTEETGMSPAEYRRKKGN